MSPNLFFQRYVPQKEAGVNPRINSKTMPGVLQFLSQSFIIYKGCKESGSCTGLQERLMLYIPIGLVLKFYLSKYKERRRLMALAKEQKENIIKQYKLHDGDTGSRKCK